MLPERATRVRKPVPTEADAGHFLELVRNGVSPYWAARWIGPYTASTFRRLANHWPGFAELYWNARLDREQLLEQQRQPKTYERDCAQCGTPHAFIRANGRYCSSACKKRAYYWRRKGRT